MDAVSLQILHQSLRRDAEVVAHIAQLAQQRAREEQPGAKEACGYELHRLYNVLEKSFERVCEAFENHFEKHGSYHEKLLERMTLDLPGLRPPFVPEAACGALRELKSFRHLIRHAYDLELQPARLLEITRLAARTSKDFPEWIERFIQRVASELPK